LRSEISINGDSRHRTRLGSVEVQEGGLANTSCLIIEPGIDEGKCSMSEQVLSGKDQRPGLIG
jgi:hypothetical protein